MMGINMTPVVKNLLIINVLLFILCILIASQFHIDLNKALGLYYIKSDYFQPWQLFTHMFMHSYGAGGGIYFMHILSNMFALFMFGPALERVWGPKRFLLFYLVCGLGAATIQSGVTYYEMHQLEERKINFQKDPSPENYFFFYKAIDNKTSEEAYREFAANKNDPNYVEAKIAETNEIFTMFENIPMVGASGAIFGILLGFGMLFPNTVLMLLFPPIPIKAKYFVAIYALIELYAGVYSPRDSVAHFAHLGGMIFAFILIKYWQKQRNSFY